MTPVGIATVLQGDVFRAVSVHDVSAHGKNVFLPVFFLFPQVFDEVRMV